MSRWMAAALGVAALAAQDPAGARREEARKTVAAALEKTAARGGLVLSGSAEVKPPKAEGMTFEIGDPDAGPQVQGAFSARLAADGTAVAAFEHELYRYEVFGRGGKCAQRLCWSGKGAPVVGDVGGDLHRLLQWKAVVKELKSKGAESKPDAVVGGTPCKVVACSVSAAYLDPPPHRKPEHAPNLEVASVEATFSIGASDGLVKQIDIEVSRKMNLVFGGGEEDILVVSVYRLTVGSYDAALKLDVPADVEKMMK